MGLQAMRYLDICVPSDVRQIEGIVEEVVRRCKEHRFASRQLSLNVPVALTEALSNAMLRGNGDDAEKQVKVRADVSEQRLVLEVEDEGKGFDLEECTEDPTTAENIMREDGRGLFLMQRLMDRVERYRNGGNVVRLTLDRR
ncbi:MAG TPA: ATP-binding protein [Gemmatimonadaceae bacterium]|jgi:serine/threonine-protein kinase RsbW|nr:ATP-binding protein [Gemmatimonadaceae bacterium]